MSSTAGLNVAGGLTADTIKVGNIRGNANFPKAATVVGGLTVDRIVASKHIKATVGMAATGGLTADKFLLGAAVTNATYQRYPSASAGVLVGHATGANANVDTTYQGNVTSATTAYTIDDIVTALKNLGILAP